MFWMCIRIASVILRTKIEFFLFLCFDSDPDFPQFCYMLGGNMGSLLYGDVSVMRTKHATSVKEAPFYHIFNKKVV